jgi:hypothetical protein
MVTSAGIANLAYDNNLRFDIDDNVPFLLVIPKSLFAETKQVLFNNEEIPFNQFNQNATHYWLRIESTMAGTFLIIPSVTYVPPTCGPGTIEKDHICIPEEKPLPKINYGCLIATATFGTELAPQVQMLREIRDNTILQTNSGLSFMTTFNHFYYSFSPTVADWERQNPVFKEAIKTAITPLISTLSILNYVESDEELLVVGVGVILLNIGMYFAIPVFAAVKLRRYLSR